MNESIYRMISRNRDILVHQQNDTIREIMKLSSEVYGRIMSSSKIRFRLEELEELNESLCHQIDHLDNKILEYKLNK